MTSESSLKINEIKEKIDNRENDQNVCIKNNNNNYDIHKKAFTNNITNDNMNDNKKDKEKENNNIINQNKEGMNNQDFINVDNITKNINVDININNNQKNKNDDSNDSSDEEENYYNRNEIINFQNDSDVCGIKNLGNNCYLNSGLQILASCEELVNFLNKGKYRNLGPIVKEFKKALNSLLTEKIYNPKKFIDCFCELNTDFIKGNQNCSQNFIRTILRNINKDLVNNNSELIEKNYQYPNSNTKELEEYEKFIKKIFPESKEISLFSVITKSHSFGNCPHCKNIIDDYSFSYFLDQSMYLDEIDSDCKFSDVLYENLGKCNSLTMDCPKCND